jgi:hypothetical protein
MPSSSERIRMYNADVIARRVITSITTGDDLTAASLEFQPQGTY